MHPVLESRKEALIELCRRYGVVRLEAFGSVVGPDFDVESSDLDFVVAFEPAPPGIRTDRYFGLLGALQVLFSRDVDLVEFDAIRNPYFRRSVESTRQLVYAA